MTSGSLPQRRPTVNTFSRDHAREYGNPVISSGARHA
jgi:hypothetical protein